MENITKNLQFVLLTIILISTIIAVGIEIKTMFINQSVTLADLLLMFLYLEVLAMVRVFWDQQSISITLPLLIAITALSRFIILQGKEMDPTGLVYEAVAILLIAGAIKSTSTFRCPSINAAAKPVKPSPITQTFCFISYFL